jgi:hypothetical protein
VIKFFCNICRDFPAICKCYRVFPADIAEKPLNIFLYRMHIFPCISMKFAPFKPCTLPKHVRVEILHREFPEKTCTFPVRDCSALFIIVFRPEILKFHPYSILTGDTRVEFVIYCMLSKPIFPN